MPYHVKEWIDAAAELKHDITLITSLSPEFLKKINFNSSIKIIQVEYPGSGIRNYFKLYKNFRQKISLTVSSQEFDLIYERFSQISNATAASVKNRNIPYCVEVNGIIENELVLSGASTARQYFFRYIQKKVYQSCDRIITVTEQIREWIHTRYSIPENKIKTFNNGVNIKTFRPFDKTEARKKFNLPADKFIVGFLGSLFPWNGLPHLIEAAEIIIKKYPDTLFLIGGGQEPMKSELEDSVNKKKLNDCFIFSGQIEWKDAPVFISTFDIAALPADFKQLSSGISPQKLYSYIACGKPVIASDTPGLPDFFRKYNIGLIFKSGNPADLAEKVFILRTMPEDQLKKFSLNARNCAVENHSWRKIVKDSINWILSERTA
jgi:glycosyltransferase involved in cell wall biosynthesis